MPAKNSNGHIVYPAKTHLLGCTPEDRCEYCRLFALVENKAKPDEYQRIIKAMRKVGVIWPSKGLRRMDLPRHQAFLLEFKKVIKEEGGYTLLLGPKGIGIRRSPQPQAK